MQWRWKFGLIALLPILISACVDKPGDSSESLFELLDASYSGIDFENTITESDSLNILDYEYIYNGGGVAIADFNNDGLQEVFFTGNMVDNALYANLGDMRFKDITSTSGVAATGIWCTGVAVVDANQDGLSDLYVTAATPWSESLRKNLLYINVTGDDGQIAFEEQAEAYGIADAGYSINSAFFDYDNDGDLDLFIINNEMQDKRNPSTYVYTKSKNYPGRIDKLYRNDDGSSFTDVSAEAGILFEGYSLGLNIVDINRDGWKDIYITNDFISEDLLYINNADGTFTNKASDWLKHLCHSAMGNDVTDINNDGLADILALDMLPEDNYRKKTMMGPKQLHHVQLQ